MNPVHTDISLHGAERLDAIITLRPAPCCARRFA
jgi:hypothetical protein